MAKITTLVLMIFFLSGCRSLERKLICAQLEQHKIRPHELCDISFSPTPRCRCRQFDFNSWEALGPAENFDLTYCQGVVGFRVSDVTSDIKPNIKALYKIKENLCQ